jgi:hypothetical protein
MSETHLALSGQGRRVERVRIDPAAGINECIWF